MISISLCIIGLINPKRCKGRLTWPPVRDHVNIKIRCERFAFSAQFNTARSIIKLHRFHTLTLLLKAIFIYI